MPSRKEKLIQSIKEAWPEDVLQSYQPVRPLGSGAFGSVTLATSSLNKSDLVAIKVINVTEEGTGVDRQYVRREIEILRELEHPNIVKIKETWTQSGLKMNKDISAVVAMSFANGKTLEQLLEEGGAYSTQFGRLVMAQLVDAVAYMHGRAVVHRDIKPANVVVSIGGKMKKGKFSIWNTDKFHEDEGPKEGGDGSDEDYDLLKVLLPEYHVTLVDFGFARALSPHDLVENDPEEGTQRSQRELQINSRGRRISFSRMAYKKMSAVGTQMFGAPEIFNGAYDNESHCALPNYSDHSTSSSHGGNKHLTKTIMPVVANYGMISDSFALGNTFKVMMTGVDPDCQDIEQKVRIERWHQKRERELITMGKLLGKLTCQTPPPEFQYRTLKELPLDMRNMIKMMTRDSPTHRISVRACRRQKWMCSLLGCFHENDEIDFLKFTLAEQERRSLGKLSVGKASDHTNLMDSIPEISDDILETLVEGTLPDFAEEEEDESFHEESIREEEEAPGSQAFEVPLASTPEEAPEEAPSPISVVSPLDDNQAPIPKLPIADDPRAMQEAPKPESMLSVTSC